MSALSLLHGFLPVNKPVLCLSRAVTDLVGKALLKGKLAVGHVGTLDPLAEGVVALAIGKATKFINYLPSSKEYIGTVKFGYETQGWDLEGVPVRIHDASNPGISDKLLASFEGDAVAQTPPARSAINIGGRRALELSREQGVESVQQLLNQHKSRTVAIHSVEQMGWCGGPSCTQPELTIRVKCEGGTYIRSLAHDIGAAAGCAATLSALQRTKSSGFRLEDCVSVEELLRIDQQGLQHEADRWIAAVVVEELQHHIIPPDVALHHLPAYVLDTRSNQVAQQLRSSGALMRDEHARNGSDTQGHLEKERGSAFPDDPMMRVLQQWHSAAACVATRAADSPPTVPAAEPQFARVYVTASDEWLRKTARQWEFLGRTGAPGLSPPLTPNERHVFLGVARLERQVNGEQATLRKDMSMLVVAEEQERAKTRPAPRHRKRAQ